MSSSLRQGGVAQRGALYQRSNRPRPRSDAPRRRGESGRLDVGVFGSGALSLVPQVLRRYSTLYPNVQIVLLNVMQSAQVEALRQRRLLITFDRYLPEEPDLTVEIVARERQLVALQEDNPLAKRPVVPMQALARERFIVGRDARHAHRVAALCQANGFDPHIGQEAGDMVTGLALVANGYGVQIVPESIRAVSMPGLVYRAIKAKGDSSIALQCAPAGRNLIAACCAARRGRDFPVPGRTAWVTVDRKSDVHK